MAKKNGSNSMNLSATEQSTLRILLAQREITNASAAAASASVRNYLIQLLQGRGLDPQKWGVTPDMTSFTEIKQPTAPPPPTPAQVASAAAPAASDGVKQTFVESAPAPAPTPAPDAAAAPAAS